MTWPDLRPALLTNLRRRPDREVALQRYALLAKDYENATSKIREVRRRAIDLLALRSGETVFDVACGTGAMLPDMAWRVGPQGCVIGIEQSAPMALLARAAIRDIPQAQVHVCPIESFVAPRPADALAFIYAHDVQQDPAALAAVFAQARPGARVVAAGLCLLPWWRLPINAWVLWGARNYLTTWHGLRQPWQPLLDSCPDLQIVERFHAGTTYLATGTVAPTRVDLPGRAAHGMFPSRCDSPQGRSMRRRHVLHAALALGAGVGARANDAALPRPVRPQLAVALGSGAIHGLAHIGVVRAFEELAIVPDLIVGCSAGAIVGALWAAGVGSTRMEVMARGIDFTTLGDPSLPWRAFMHNRRLERLVDDAVGGRPIERLPIRFAAVATALDDGRRVTLDRGPTGAAVAASSAIPVVYEPVRLGGRELVDGSLSAPVPVDAARDLGAHIVLAVDVAYRPDEAPARHIVDMAFQTLHILVNALGAEQLVRADIALRLSLHEMIQQHDAPLRALVDVGRRSMLAKAPMLRAMLQQPK